MAAMEKTSVQATAMTADLARLRDIDPEILRNRIPWIASQMRDAGMYTQASEIESILPLLTELEQLRAELKHRCVCRFTSGGHLKGQLCEYHRRLMNSEIEELANIARQGIGFSREVCAAAILERKK